MTELTAQSSESVYNPAYPHSDLDGAVGHAGMRDAIRQKESFALVISGSIPKVWILCDTCVFL